MYNKVFFCMFCFFLLAPIVSCTAEENNSVADLVIEIEDDAILLYGDFIDDESDIVRDFYGLLKSRLDGDCVVISKNGYVKNSFGDILIDLSHYDPPFFGFRLKSSYPTNKLYTPGIILIPYFFTGESVGDSIVIEWDYEKETFKKREYFLP